MAFLHAAPEKLHANRRESSAKGRAALQAFREMAKASRLCSFWLTSKELGSRITQAIDRAKRTKPGGGWIKQASLPKTAFTKTLRGRTILDGVIEAGVKDVETWNLRENALPPERFFLAANREIAISAATAYATLNEYGELLKSLAKSKSVKFLLLHPARGVQELKRWSLRDGSHFKDMVRESRNTLQLVAEKRYQEAFHFRFRNRLAPFTAVMIDGDVDNSEHPADAGGQLRMHPCSEYSFGSKGGLIIHLTKTRSGSSAFDYYASDLRKQWAEAKEDRDLFESEAVTP